MDKKYIARAAIFFCTIDIAVAPVIAIQLLELRWFIILMFYVILIHSFIMYIVYQIINDLK